MKGIIKFSRKVVKVLLEMTVIAGIMTIFVGSNLDLKQLFEGIAMVGIALAIVVDFVKEVEVDHQRKEWATN